MDEEKLIVLVRQYVFLYDKSHPKYMDITKKGEAWNEISQNLNQPASVCKHKWQTLRDAYRRALNKRKQRLSEEPTAKIKKWKFEDEISYLNKYLGEKKKASQNENDSSNECDDDAVSYSDIEASVKNERDDIEHTENLEQYIVGVDSVNENSPSHIAKNIQRNPQKWANSRLSPSSYVITDFSEETPKEYKESEVTHDQMDLFFLNLSNTIKTFPPFLQAIAKNKIFNLVSELEIQQLAPDNNNTNPQTSTTQTDWPTTTQATKPMSCWRQN